MCLSIYLTFFFLLVSFSFFFFGCPTACGSSHARDQIQASAVTYTAADVRSLICPAGQGIITMSQQCPMLMQRQHGSLTCCARVRTPYFTFSSSIPLVTDIWVFFHPLSSVNNAVMNMRIDISLRQWFCFLWIDTQKWVAGSYGSVLLFFFFFFLSFCLF